jgi:hypothetical protein
MASEEVPLFNTAILTREIDIPFVEIDGLDKRNAKHNLKNLLRTKLRHLMESKCVEDGYVMPNTIEIKDYSYGLCQSNKIKFSVLFSCDICLPTADTTIECVVKSISNGGIRAVLNGMDPSPLVIFVAREITDMDLSTFNEGDVFKAKIFGIQFELNDKFISVLAKIEEN